MASDSVRKVSIVMCTYNGASFLREQLETIINQTYPLHEIIIQDDRSEDTTRSIIMEYMKKYPIIKFYTHKEERGINSNFFSALKKASGDYIAISDQDDLWEPEKIEHQMTMMEKAKEALLCYHFSKHFSEDGVPVEFNKRMPNYTLMRMIYFNELPGHTMLLRKELLKNIVDEHCFLYDALLAIAAGVQDRIVFLPEVLVHQRRYNHAFSYRPPLSTDRNLKNMILYLREAIQNMTHNKRSMKQHFNTMFSLLSQYESWDHKAPCFSDALRLCDWYRSYDGLSILKASLTCAKYRKHIFYTGQDNNLLLFFRALLHPLLMFRYYK